MLGSTWETRFPFTSIAKLRHTDPTDMYHFSVEVAAQGRLTLKAPGIQLQSLLSRNGTKVREEGFEDDEKACKSLFQDTSL